jgi:uncharacterized protein RhaS with RHS repeats
LFVKRLLKVPFSPARGRFIGEDPIGFAGGDTNLYGYAFNSPSNFTDPSGEVVPVGLLIVLAGAAAGGVLGDFAITSLAGRKPIPTWKRLGAVAVGTGLGVAGGYGATAIAANAGLASLVASAGTATTQQGRERLTAAVKAAQSSQRGLSEFFKTGQRGPEITDSVLRAYRELAVQAIERYKTLQQPGWQDAIRIQQERIQQIDKVLNGR